MNIPWTLVVIICLFLQTIVSIAELSILSCNKLKLMHRSTQNWISAHIIRFMHNHTTIMIISSLISFHVIIQICSEAIVRSYESFGISTGLFSFIQTIVMILLVDVTPIHLINRYADMLVYNVGPILVIPFIILYTIYQLIRILLSPFTKYYFRDSSKVLTKSEVSKYELIDLINAPTTNMLSNFSNTINRILCIYDKPISTIMSNKNKYALPYTSSRNAIAAMFQKTKLTHLPISQSKKIIGFINFKVFATEYKTFDIRKNIDKAWFIQASTKISSTMEMFSKSGLDVAVVLHNKDAIGIITKYELYQIIFSTIPTEGFSFNNNELSLDVLQ